MATVEFKLNDWKAWAAVGIFTVLGLGRIALMRDLTGNKELMRAINGEIMTSYYSALTDKLQKPVKEGEEAAAAKDAESLTESKLKIESVQGYLPYLSSSNQPRDVVIRVKYAVKEKGVILKGGVKFYRYEHRTPMDAVVSLYDSDAISYYLMFF